MCRGPGWVNVEGRLGRHRWARRQPPQAAASRPAGTLYAG